MQLLFTVLLGWEVGICGRIQQHKVQLSIQNLQRQTFKFYHPMKLPYFSYCTLQQCYGSRGSVINWPPRSGFLLFYIKKFNLTHVFSYGHENVQVGSGSVNNGPTGSGTILLDYGSTDPDP